ncbi:mitoguardin 2 [Brachyhypopomus gauderio]|uniref:mitoguardin 2 n=1 Tax=Brachyhypopomus gauderio TaxID=698409 RepID=UPI00404144AA
MSISRAESMSIMQALAMTVAEIPVFLYSTFGQSIFSQLRLSPGLKKVLFATALGTVALALTAHQLKRRGRKRKQVADRSAPKPGSIPDHLLRGRPMKGPFLGRQMKSPSTRSNDTMSGISSLAASKHSSSSHSITSARVPPSPNQPVTVGGPWEAEPVAEETGAIEDTDAENLYVMGMQLFEEALQKWEQALNARHQAHSGSSARNSLVLQGAAYIPEGRSRKFAEKLECLLHRAYHLQEDFGSTIPPDSLLTDLESEGTLILPTVGSTYRLLDDDATTITSDNSFFSAAELFDAFTEDEVYQPLKPAALYEEALSLVRDGNVDCRSFRTELLECYSDQDFLAKLHCVRQAFYVLLLDDTQRTFFMETGKQIITGLMIKANKSPKAFLESYQDMLLYTQREETWPITKMELEGRGVVCMNFFDIVLDFILMDAFEDLENPPTSVVAVLRNRWLSDSFKETALATACWSVLKAKRRLLMVPDGFISHFYTISEHVSPVLAFGFLGPRLHLSEVCTIFKQQIVQYLKDMFDQDKVRFTSAQSLAEDILSLSHRRADILLGYLGTDGLPETNGVVPSSLCQADDAGLLPSGQED